MLCPHCGQALPMRPGHARTPTQQRTLMAIVALTASRGYAPTVRELCAHLGLRSSSTVHGHLVALGRDGLITWQPDSPRSVCVVGQSETPAG